MIIHLSPLCLSPMPLPRGHITLYKEAGNMDVLGIIYTGVVNPGHLRAPTLILCSCEHARKSSNTMLTRPKVLGHFRFLSHLNDGSTQFNAYQNSFFGKGQSLVEN